MLSLGMNLTSKIVLKCETTACLRVRCDISVQCLTKVTHCTHFWKTSNLIVFWTNTK